MIVHAMYLSTHFSFFFSCGSFEYSIPTGKRLFLGRKKVSSYARYRKTKKEVCMNSVRIFLLEFSPFLPLGVDSNQSKFDFSKKMRAYFLLPRGSINRV